MVAPDLSMGCHGDQTKKVFHPSGLHQFVEKAKRQMQPALGLMGFCE